MGRARHEILRLGEAGDHPAGRTIPPAGSSHARANRDPEIDVLSLVRSVSDRRARGAGRSQVLGLIGCGTVSPMTSARGSSTLALDEPELSPRELAVRFTDAERYFVSEAS